MGRVTEKPDAFVMGLMHRWDRQRHFILISQNKPACARFITQGKAKRGSVIEQWLDESRTWWILGWCGDMLKGIKRNNRLSVTRGLPPGFRFVNFSSSPFDSFRSRPRHFTSSSDSSVHSITLILPLFCSLFPSQSTLASPHTYGKMQRALAQRARPSALFNSVASSGPVSSLRPLASQSQWQQRRYAHKVHFTFAAEHSSCRSCVLAENKNFAHRPLVSS